MAQQWRMWCPGCGSRHVIPPDPVQVGGLCPACGEGLKLDSRDGQDRRQPSLRRRWDPEPRSGADRRSSAA